jgi:hypothetical protein
VHPPHPAQRAGRPDLSSARAPLPVLQRWWFWVGLMALLWLFPLWKSLTADLPARLPGEDGPALDVSLDDELGRPFRLADLRGRVVVLTALPLAEARARDATWGRLVKLRKRLRGLDQALVYAVLAQGGSAADLHGWLEEHRAPRPELFFGMDEGGAEMKRLCAQAGAASAEFLLIDRHGRIRGAYGGEPAEVERLIVHAGQLCNWEGQDPPP